MEPLTKFIVYACPVGPLARQIDAYFERTRTQIGLNTAHEYMPHITLTGFFHDQPSTALPYVQTLDTALSNTSVTDNPLVTINELLINEQFHGLGIDAPWLKELTAVFAQNAHSPTRSDNIRLKDWLHLSLAYGFQPEQAEPLAQLAREMIDLNTAVSWELRFYQRHPDKSWTCHATWPL